MRVLTAVLFFLCASKCFGQTLSGEIKDSNLKKINSSISIFLKEINTPNKIIDYKIVYNSSFSFKLKKRYQSLLLEIKAFGYKDFVKKVEKINTNTIYHYKINLIKDTIYKLDEVIIKGNKKFEVKKDTIVYKVDSYKTQSDRKVIDVIKKLPGIEIDNSTGKIKYNGKSIETVLLEGDNLFGANYTIGTKNININMVKEIQAVKKFSENPLLKGIEKTDKIALNLILKKNKFDVSVDANLSIGAFNKTKLAADTQSNLLTISKKQKGFTTVSYNNIGNNYTPFNYSSNNINIENIKEQELKAPKIITETSLINIFDDNRANINNQLFGNINHIFSSSKKFKVKVNLFYLKDRIKNNTFYENQLFINNTSFTTFDSLATSKRPTQLRSDIDLKITPSKNTYVNYTISLRGEKIETPSLIKSNNNNNSNANLHTDDFFLKQNLKFTKKITSHKAFQLNILHAIDKLNQNYKISSNTNTQSTLDYQVINSQKKTIQINTALLGSSKTNNSYKFSIGGGISNNNLFSKLFSPQNSSNQNNNISYFKKNLKGTTTYNFNLKKWAFSPTLELKYLRQQLVKNKSTQSKTKNNFLLNSKIKSKYKINSHSSIVFFVNFKQKVIAENYLFENPILLNNRLSKKNTVSLNLQKQQNFGFSYNNNDLYNQLQINALIQLQKNKGNFFTNSTYTENTTTLNYFYLPEFNNTYIAHLVLAKYIPFLETTLRINSNYIFSNFKNIVNNSQLQNVNSKNLVLKLSGITAFDSFINFENAFSYFNSKTNIKTISTHFKNSFITNKLKIILTPFDNYVATILNNYTYNNSNSNSFNLTDFNLRYKKKNYNFGFKIKNIFNESEYEQIYITDISTNIFRTNILGRYFLINFSINF